MKRTERGAPVTIQPCPAQNQSCQTVTASTGRADRKLARQIAFENRYSHKLFSISGRCALSGIFRLRFPLTAGQEAPHATAL